jgi:hypothetical protein
MLFAFQAIINLYVEMLLTLITRYLFPFLFYFVLFNAAWISALLKIHSFFPTSPTGNWS